MDGDREVRRFDGSELKTCWRRDIYSFIHSYRLEIEEDRI